ncbi:L,D-transpeptidase catalytic domain protein [Methylocella silvestris]|uniref:L,D-transpeptidase catalytic domain protein n=2 Tax=Methylocella silvestris TaxID=199596 RepID=A0A2J7TJR0_METSI|nr:L,D-transpeptidase catalytic domain protein [Methylocella silvestris]
MKTPPKRLLGRLVATRLPGRTPAGRLQAADLSLPCAIGSAGVRHDKREGDHASPAGSWRLLYGFFRADRHAPRAPLLPMRAARRQDGWCDDPASALYNRRVATPFASSFETLWRDDRLYDIVIVLDYNIHPRRKGRGSAIFLHCARDGFAPTEGCIALRPQDFRRLLPRLSSQTILTIR